jgi:flagellar motor switch protein FliN/FliY
MSETDPELENEMAEAAEAVESEADLSEDETGGDEEALEGEDPSLLADIAGDQEASIGEDGLNAETTSGEDSGVEEALQAWTEGGHALDEFDDDDAIASVRFPQLEPAVARRQERPDLLNNVWVDVAVELGRKDMKVSQIANLKEQDVIELDKLAGEAFEIRINGRLFAQGEVVVVSDLMAVRITSLSANVDTQKKADT